MKIDEFRVNYFKNIEISDGLAFITNRGNYVQVVYYERIEDFGKDVIAINTLIKVD